MQGVGCDPMMWAHPRDMTDVYSYYRCNMFIVYFSILISLNSDYVENVSDFLLQILLLLVLDITGLVYHMSHIMKKPVLGIYDHLRLNPACTFIETS